MQAAYALGDWLVDGECNESKGVGPLSSQRILRDSVQLGIPRLDVLVPLPLEGET